MRSRTHDSIPYTLRMITPHEGGGHEMHVWPHPLPAVLSDRELEGGPVDRTGAPVRMLPPAQTSRTCSKTVQKCIWQGDVLRWTEGEVCELQHFREWLAWTLSRFFSRVPCEFATAVLRNMTLKLSSSCGFLQLTLVIHDLELCPLLSVHGAGLLWCELASNL